ncbi:MAG: DPP IV N-terminal domain-containing protein, partial [Acidobacteriota bacterium]
MQGAKKFFSVAASWLLVFLWANFTSVAQTERKILTAEDYARAEKFLSQYTEPLVFGGSVQPNWIDENCFWHRNNILEGYEFILVDIEKKQRKRAFDHQKLAEALSKASGESYEPFKLPFRNIEFSSDRNFLMFTVDSIHYKYDLQKNLCTEIEKKKEIDRNVFVSPDGKLGAFIRDYNLWVKDLTTGEETQLTKDGIKDFGYATNNAGWIKSERPVLLWSPDSKKIATFQHDGRKVGEMYLVTTDVGHPKLEAWKYPLPGDDFIFQIHRVVIHLDGSRVVQLQMPPDQHRSTITDHIALRNGELADAEWSPDSSQFAFASVSRDHKHVVLRIADPETGEVRDILEEKVDTFFESGFNKVNWHILPESNEVLWFSQRDDWGHLYLYDLDTGKLKRRLTKGSWNVLQVLRIDREERVIYFTGCGREKGDPYFQYLYRVSLNGSEIELLTPENSNHTITFSPSGQYFVHSYSTPEEPPVSEVCDLNGRKLFSLEKADISSLIKGSPPEKANATT